LVHRPVRVLGGPAARAADGGNQSLPLLLLNVARAALGACLSPAALGGPELHPPDPALTGIDGFGLLDVSASLTPVGLVRHC
jgi:hypothetical protein